MNYHAALKNTVRNRKRDIPGAAVTLAGLAIGLWAAKWRILILALLLYLLWLTA